MAGHRRTLWLSALLWLVYSNNIHAGIDENSFWHPYVELKGSAIKCEKGTYVADGLSGEAAFKWGWAGSLEVGTIYQDLRFALEAMYGNVKMKRFHGGPIHFESHGSTFKSEVFSGLINLYYDRNLTDQWDLYLGAGIGLARLEGKFHIPAIPPAVPAAINTKGHVTKFAWQIMVGSTYHFNENWALKGGYRFFKIQGKDFTDTHCLEIGLRYTF